MPLKCQKNPPTGLEKPRFSQKAKNPACEHPEIFRNTQKSLARWKSFPWSCFWAPSREIFQEVPAPALVAALQQPSRSHPRYESLFTSSSQGSTAASMATVRMRSTARAMGD